MTTPTPAEATYVSDWELADHPDDYRRHFTTSHRATVAGDLDGTPGGLIGGMAQLSIQGEQTYNGDVIRYAYVEAESGFTARQLRVLAAACLDTADTLDALGALSRA